MSLLRSLALAGLCVAVYGASLSAFEEKKPEAPKVEEGKPAPDVELQATQIDKVLPDKKDAKTMSLKEFQGKKNVVMFFTF